MYIIWTLGLAVEFDGLLNRDNLIRTEEALIFKGYDNVSSDIVAQFEALSEMDKWRYKTTRAFLGLSLLNMIALFICNIIFFILIKQKKRSR